MISMGPANLITSLRIAIAPLMIGMWLSFGAQAAFEIAILFAFGALTDMLDGYIARHFDEVSALGRLLDPVADKILMFAALVIVMTHYSDRSFLGGLILLASWVIITRDFVLSGLRQWGGEQSIRVNFSVNDWGKMKTLLQMISVSGLLFAIDVNLPFRQLCFTLSVVLFLLGMVMAIVSLGIYLYGARRAFLPNQTKIDE